MKIKSIELKNYRLYKGLNQVVFPNGNNKNLYLISGENGFGKTTFLHSLIWCLYGRLMGEIDDSFKKEMLNGGYSGYVLNNLNNICRQKLNEPVLKIPISNIKKNGYSFDSEFVKTYSEYFVSMEFSDVQIPSIPCHSIKVTRYFDYILDKENIEILIDGVPNELTNEIGNEVFINDFILNKDIARFFFFDSEKIVSIAESNTIEEKRKLCSAYNEVLGVKKYEDLKKNLENMRLRFRRRSDDLESRNKLNSLLIKQNSLNEEINRKEQELLEIESQLIIHKKEDENLQISLLREGNKTTIDEFKRQEALLEVIRKKDTEYKQQIKQFLDFAPFVITGKLLLDTKLQIERDFNIVQNKSEIKNQNILLQEIKSEMQKTFDFITISKIEKNNLIDSFNKIILKFSKDDVDEIPLLNLSKNEINEFNAVYSNLTSTYKVEFERLADDYRKNKQVLDRTVRNISSMKSKENDNVIKTIRKKKNEIEKKINDLELKIRQVHEDRGELKKDLTVINRQVSEYSKKVSLDDNDSKKDNVANTLIKELNSFLFLLKEEKKSALEKRIETIMNNLMHKTDFIRKVNILVSDDILDVNLYNSLGNLIKKESLSKGEQQLYATSFLKALVEESNIQFPVFIDSPLQKFDKSHATKIITEFYPTVSKQVILFPLLHKELTENELETMKPYINSSYLLKNNNTDSYIQQVDINSLMTE